VKIWWGAGWANVHEKRDRPGKEKNVPVHPDVNQPLVIGGVGSHIGGVAALERGRSRRDAPGGVVQSIDPPPHFGGELALADTPVYDLRIRVTKWSRGPGGDWRIKCSAVVRAERR
jgi:hypothetical protein